MFQEINNKLRQAFSESADRYDILASLHREIGRELMQKLIEAVACNTILDIGCGTGYVTNKAKVYFPYSTVIGLDFAQGMIFKAKEKYEEISWLIADAKSLPFKPNSIDVIVSNLAYQWIDPLQDHILLARHVLSDEGIMAITLFGQETCVELMESLKAVGIQPLRRLPNIIDVKNAFQSAGFNDTFIDYERIKIQFSDIMELLMWLKNIGANYLPVEGYLGKDKLNQAGEYYREHYSYHHGICATFEVIWVKAKK